ncbi:hypothetical protein [Albimonas pacifica]|uniref:Prophage tail length tape measure protein n=1 Tax=Albimonas pacifica TaxID=1114924 RepID=A0A1I3HIH9_9RHOB|nr:hypothetical protein [Albimonas pacifica]SFI35377.1 Prophage tail length tape measure protein [Albimonas pacifica]
MNIATGAALDVDIRARLDPFEAQLRETDAMLARAGASMAVKAEALDRALADVGKRFGKEIDFSDIDRDLAQMQARIDAAFSGGSFENPDLPGVMAELSAAQEAFSRLQAQVDPAAAALRTYEAAQEKVARAVELGMVSQREANDVLARAGQAYETAISGLQRYEAVAQTSARASAQVFQEFFAAGDAVAAVERQLDPAAAALRQYETVQAEVARAVELGAVTQADANRVLAQAGQRYEDVISSLQRVEAANAGSARASAEVFQQFDAAADSVAGLERQLDPATAALHQYEAAQQTVARAVELGAVSQADANRVLGLAGQRYSAQMAALGRGAQIGSRSFNRFSGEIQQAGYQVGDFAVQVASGQNALVALTQQGAQLLGAFGPWGAVIGAAGAIVGALTISLMDGETEAKSFEDRARDLSKVVQAYRDAAEGAKASTVDLAKTYGAASGAAQIFLNTLAGISKADAIKEANEIFAELGETLQRFDAGSPQAYLKVADALSAVYERFAELGSKPSGLAIEDALKATGVADASVLAGEIERLSETFETTIARAGELASALATLQGAKGPREQAEAAKALLAAMEAALGPVDEMNGEARGLYEALAEAGRAAADLAGAGQGAGNAIAYAVEKAEDLVQRLREAVDQAAELTRSSISGLVEARIRYELRDDPISRAKALAGLEFDRRTGDVSGADPILQQGLALQREEFIATAAAAAEYEQKLANWKRASKSGSKDADQLADAVFNAKARLEEMTAALGDDGAQLGLTGDALVRHRAQTEAAAVAQNLLTRAKREGWTVSAEELEQLDDLQKKYVEAAVANDDLRRSHEANEQATRDVADSFQDAILSADSFGDAIKNLTVAFAELLAEWIKAAAIEGEGPLAALLGGGSYGAGGSGIVGMIGSAVLRGVVGGYFGGPDLTADPTPGMFGRAMGGGVRAGEPYYVNEHLHGGAREEIFVPSVNGAVLNVPQAQAALRDGAGGSRVIFKNYGADVSVDTSGLDTIIAARVDTATQRAVQAVEKAVAAPGSGMDRAMSGRGQKRGSLS